jgi:hypothetical protein
MGPAGRSGSGSRPPGSMGIGRCRDALQSPPDRSECSAIPIIARGSHSARSRLLTVMAGVVRVGCHSSAHWRTLRLCCRLINASGHALSPEFCRSEFNRAAVARTRSGLIFCGRMKIGRNSTALFSKHSSINASRPRLATANILEDRFTAADLLMTTVLRIPRQQPIVEQYGNLFAHKERCEARPACQRALRDQIQDFERNPPPTV